MGIYRAEFSSSKPSPTLETPLESCYKIGSAEKAGVKIGHVSSKG